MNKDQANGAAQYIGGRLLEEFGKIFDAKHQSMEGLKLQVSGKLQEGMGDLKGAAEAAE